MATLLVLSVGKLLGCRGKLLALQVLGAGHGLRRGRKPGLFVRFCGLLLFFFFSMGLPGAAAGGVGRRVARRETVVDLLVDARARLVLGLLMGRSFDVAHRCLPMVMLSP